MQDMQYSWHGKKERFRHARCFSELISKKLWALMGRKCTCIRLHHTHKYTHSGWCVPFDLHGTAVKVWESSKKNITSPNAGPQSLEHKAYTAFSEISKPNCDGCQANRALMSGQKMASTSHTCRVAWATWGRNKRRKKRERSEHRVLMRTRKASLRHPDDKWSMAQHNRSKAFKNIKPRPQCVPKLSLSRSLSSPTHIQAWAYGHADIHIHYSVCTHTHT